MSEPADHCVAFLLCVTDSSFEWTHGSPQKPPPPTGKAGCFPGTAGPGSDCGQDGVRYFSVVWCKASKKKHKRWEGDAVLITRGRTATLKDMEGKDIGQGEAKLLPVSSSIP